MNILIFSYPYPPLQYNPYSQQSYQPMQNGPYQQPYGIQYAQPVRYPAQPAQPSSYPQYDVQQPPRAKAPAVPSIRIRGFEKDGCCVYLGIPFAMAPVGEYAFRHPLPPEPWEGVLDATLGSSNPIQGKGGFYISNNSQDCLYLNVFVPEGVSAPRPVMVWIYGGAYSQGGAGAEEKDTRKLQYDLARFAKETG